MKSGRARGEDEAPLSTVVNRVPFSKQHADDSNTFSTSFPRGSGHFSFYSPHGAPLQKLGTLQRNHVPFSQDSEGAPVEVGEEPVRGRRHSSFFGWFDDESSFTRRDSVPVGVNPILQRIFEWVDLVEHGTHTQGEESEFAIKHSVHDEALLLSRCGACRKKYEGQQRVVLREERDRRDLFITVREEPWAASAVFGYRVTRARGFLWFHREFAEFRIALSHSGDALAVGWRSFDDFSRLMAAVAPMCLPHSMAAWERVRAMPGAGDGPFPNLINEFLAVRARLLERLLAELLQEVPDVGTLVEFVQSPDWACRAHCCNF